MVLLDDSLRKLRRIHSSFPFTVSDGTEITVFFTSGPTGPTDRGAGGAGHPPEGRLRCSGKTAARREYFSLMTSRVRIHTVLGLWGFKSFFPTLFHPHAW